MRRRKYLVGVVMLMVLALGYAGSRGVGQDKQPDGSKPVKKEDAVKPPTWKVEKGPFKVEVTLKGILEAQEMTPVALALESWSPNSDGPLTVRKAVEHGSQVRKGDTLLWLDLDKIDHTIRDLEADRQHSDLAIRLAEKELPVLEQSAPAELAAAERAKKVADEDLQEFLKKDRAFSEQLAEFQVKSARNFLDYAREELRQLEKMYKANDLTEETEEIILRRYRNTVEMEAFFLKRVERARDQALNVELPRRDLALRESALKQGLALDRARATLDLTLAQKRLALDKLRHDRDKAADRLARLKRDREAMTVKAPADGLVYYGRCVHGHWTTAAATADKLQRGGQVHADEVLFTVVGPEKLFVRAEVEEKELPHLRPGAEGRAVPTGRPDFKLKARVETVPALPTSSGKFFARVGVVLPPSAEPLMPGLACAVKLVPYLQTEALTVPAAAVFADEIDEDRHHVYAVGEKGEPHRRTVRVGQKQGDRAEILEGLREGEEILRQRPDSDPHPSAPGKEARP